MMDTSLHLRRSGLAAALLSLALPCGAQQARDAGRLLEEVRPLPLVPQPAPPRLDIEEAPAPGLTEGTAIHVSRIRVTGATRFSPEALHELVANGENRDLTLGDLRRLAQRVTNYYRDQGYLLSRAYLPAQDVKDGVVEITVLEGSLGRIEVDNGAGLRGPALAMLEGLRPGEVVDGRALESTLLLLSDLPGVDVGATLRPGAEPGTTDVAVRLDPGAIIRGAVDADTYGDRYSGQARVGGTLALNNPLRLADQVSFRAMRSDEGLTYLRAGYQLPISASGTRLGITASALHYRLGREIAPLDANGDAQTASVSLSHPIVRRRRFNLNAQFEFDHLHTEDRVGATDTSTTRSTRNWSAGLNGDFRDRWNGGNLFSVVFTSGHLDLDATTGALDAATADTAGAFSKLNGNWARLQRLNDTNSLYLAFSGQLASKNLNSAEKISIGGATAVRAYPQGESPGDEGYVMTAEARHAFVMAAPAVWQGVAFLDHGHALLSKQPWSPGDNRRTLSGAGIGLNIVGSRGLSIKASLAWRLSRSTPDSDTDRMPRAWLQVVQAF